MKSIAYTIGKSTLDYVLVAQSSHGICAILLGRDCEALVSDLCRRFPNVNILRDDDALTTVLKSVLVIVEDPRLGFDLPLDLAGTPFQQKVWKEIATIPIGRTASYSQIAASIGLPRAVRAVAGACAANALAVVIPCHRVVRADGSVAGYRWGAERRTALLKREKV